MLKTSYAELINKLYSVNAKKAMNLGLERMEDALKILGNPERSFRSIHVAGTNGKGSVSMKIAEALLKEGCLVGLYTSPHIGTFRERILVQGIKISEADVVRLMPKAMEAGPLCTFFELTTLMAFLYFRERGVQWAVIETGIGGRLDATNVITPEVSIITSVSLDHTEWLGPTTLEISREKAGIIKEGVPVVIGPTVPSAVCRIAEEKRAPCIALQGSFKNYDQENSQVAKEALLLLNVSEKSIRQGLEKRPACRMERMKCPNLNTPVVLDVAHNPGGFKSLFYSLLSQFGEAKWRVVMGMGKDKDHEECLREVAEHACEIFLTQATGSREGINTDLLEGILLSLGFRESALSKFDSVRSAVLSAIGKSKEDGAPLLIVGTFFIMADAKEALGVHVERDPVCLSDFKKPA